ncbi:MAG: FAD-dependent oxidoreductase [Syntrophales bacterium]|jgi:pyruvate/2-oxoglutarate dehydrogenase complex dihydrolipoamide dehydrogenase (E3) component|nr:FAD-dependent oxidoreductase [Syntrophales bacterium]
MPNYDYDLGIIGGGAAGLTAAAGAAQFGAKTLLIEKTERLGGDCLHFGCVPSKTLIRTAGVWALARRSAEFGLPALPLPPVDLSAVMARVQAVIDTIQHHDSPERFCGLGVAVQFGSPSFTDEHVVALDGKRISAKSWIIATGSRPAVPPINGLATVPYWTNETVFSQRTLPGRLIVIGGGPIGLEIAESFARLGSKVMIVEFMEQILGPEDADMAEILKARLEAEGVIIHTGTKALKVESKGTAILLTVAPVAEEGQSTIIEGDALFLSTGRQPNIDDLELVKAGVKFTPHGIPTDARMRTNIPHIYACGDVNGQLPFTHVAGYEAGIALTNAVLHLPRKADYGKIGWCTYTDPEVASIGYNEKRARKEGLEYRIIEESFADNDRALAEGEALGKIKMLLDGKDKMLGCQIIGAHAGELIHEWIIAVNGGVKLSTIAGAVHVYPTLSEISKHVAGRVFADKLFGDRTKKILKFLFNLKGRACTLPYDQK